MRVLVVNKFWYPRGGLERVMFDEIAALQAAGHEVAHFSTSHPLNTPSGWSDYFADYTELGKGARVGRYRKIRAAARMFSNADARRRFDRLLRDFKPDIVHAHGVHRQLSPSVLLAAKRRGIPVVQTLHDCHHACPADYLMRGDGVPCVPRLCGRYCYGAAVRHRCVRGSLAASALSAAETSFQRLRHAYERSVTRFIAPGTFLRDVMLDAGWDSTPIDVIPNAVALDVPARADAEHFLFAGRLTAEKGVETALEAAALAGVRLLVAGTGPLEAELKARFPEAEFLGQQDPGQVRELLAKAYAAVVPSTVLENAPLAVLEPMAAGVPVIASEIGGIPELVSDGVTGILAAPGDVEAFAEAMTRITSETGLREKIGDAGRLYVEQNHSMERHMELLLASYRSAITDGQP